VDVTVTIPVSPEFLEALARRVAELLAEQPLAQRYLDAESAPLYLGVPLKTIRTKSWRDHQGIPYGQLENGRLLFDQLALDEWLACMSGQASAYAVVTPSGR
jgi:hypothetical protein